MNKPTTDINSDQQQKTDIRRNGGYRRKKYEVQITVPIFVQLLVRVITVNIDFKWKILNRNVNSKNNYSIYQEVSFYS